MPSRADSISDAQWEAIDHDICSNRKLKGILKIKEATGCDLRDALDTFYSRYEHLRQVAPDRFTDSSDEYWVGFYS